MPATIQLTDEEHAQIVKPLPADRTRWGGWQHLLWRLQGRIKRGAEGGRLVWRVTISDDDLAKFVRFSREEVGSGGYQSRLRPLLPKVEAALAEVRRQQGDLFAEEEAVAR